MLKDSFFSKNHIINFNGKVVDLSDPIVMGIMNITPDSFYSKSRVSSEDEICKRCKDILIQGGSIIDIGAYSTRPGAEDISENKEYERLSFCLGIVRKHFPDVIISVDTFRSGIARMVVENFGVQMINDISAGKLDEQMLSTIGSLGVPYIAMHMIGTPATMQLHTHYKDLILDIIAYFDQVIKQAKENGIHDIIIDPGFGFSKTLDQNYKLLSVMDSLRIFELPILVGVSRKSMIYNILKCNPEDSLAATIVLNTIALQKGATIIRVHDVKEAADTIKMIQTYNKEMISFPK